MNYNFVQLSLSLETLLFKQQSNNELVLEWLVTIEYLLHKTNFMVSYKNLAAIVIIKRRKKFFYFCLKRSRRDREMANRSRFYSIVSKRRTEHTH